MFLLNVFPKNFHHLSKTRPTGSRTSVPSEMTSQLWNVKGLASGELSSVEVCVGAWACVGVGVGGGRRGPEI